MALIDRAHGSLTPAGQGYHAHVSSAFAELQAATGALRRQNASRLEVWCAPGLAYLWLTGRLGKFRSRRPLVALDLRPSETPPNLIKDEADADIRYERDEPRATSAPGLCRLELARPEVFPVASPQFVSERAASLASAADLLSLPLLHEESDAEWRLWFERQGVAAAVPTPAARLWQAHIALGAAREGQGVALTNALLAREDLDAGRLVALAPAHARFTPVSIGAYVLAARAERLKSPALSQFSEWLRSAMA
jgi:DNA-binding transcriptional LysR family regulator